MIMPRDTVVEENNEMKRREAREKAVQTLFQLDNTELTVDEAINYIIEEPVNRFYEQLVRGTVENKEEIDEVLS